MNTESGLGKPLGVDFGRVRIGLAVGQLGWLASPLQILDTNRRPFTELAAEVLDVALQQGQPSS